MTLRLVIALALITSIFWLMKRYRTLPEKQRKQWLIKMAVGAFVVLMLLAVVTGRVHWLGGLLAAALGFAKFGVNMFARAFPFVRLFGRHAFGNPVFSTSFLKVQLDLQTNSVTGIVIEGPYKGSELHHLNDEQLAELEAHYQKHDRRSYYLIRVLRQSGQHSQHHHQQQSKQDYSSVSDPSYNEALQVLGLESYIGNNELDKKTVIQAHKRLMQKLHPDRGGNDYLASRVNVAKEIVLKKLQ